MRIGILGGSFDPIHTEHVRVARIVARKLRLDRVLLVPVYRNPYKTDRRLAPPRRRLDMIRLAIDEHAELEACDLEIRRKGISYTVDTLRSIHRRYPKADLFLLMGSDVLPTLDTWRQPEEIARRCTWVVVKRPGAPLIRPKLTGARVLRATVDVRDISSSEIRRRISAGRPIDNMVAPAVQAYIMTHKLYQS